GPRRRRRRPRRPAGRTGQHRTRRPGVARARLRRLPGRLRATRSDRRRLCRRGTGPAYRLRSAEHAIPRRTRPARARHLGAAPDERAFGHRTGLDHPHHAAAAPRHRRGRRRHAPAHRSRTSPARPPCRRHQQPTRSRGGTVVRQDAPCTIRTAPITPARGSATRAQRRRITSWVTSHGDARSPRRFVASLTWPDIPPGARPRTKEPAMTVTPTSLTKAAGISAAAAGLLFIAVQIKHPPMDVSSVTTTEWVVRQTAKTVMAATALVGITGMYLRQVRQTGILGLVGYLVFGAGYLVMMGIEFTGAYVLPSLAHTAPGYVNDVLAAGTGGTVTGDIGLMQPAFILSSVGYLAGGVLFGIALFRARVLARWASGLLVLGTLATLAIPVLPHSFQRPLAVPVGVALIGLGISLWRDQRKTAAIAADGLAPARVKHASVR